MARKAKKNESKSKCPQLVCCLTGASRNTNANYLADKAKGRSEILGRKVEVDEIVEFYVPKNVLSDLRKGATIEEVRKRAGKKAQEFEMHKMASTNPEKLIAKLFELNGKMKTNAPSDGAAKAAEARAAKEAKKTKPAAKKASKKAAQAPEGATPEPTPAPEGQPQVENIAEQPVEANG